MLHDPQAILIIVGTFLAALACAAWLAKRFFPRLHAVLSGHGRSTAGRWFGVSIKFAILFAFSLGFLWVGSGAGYEQGLQIGFQMGKVSGYKSGWKQGWTDGTTAVADSPLPVPFEPKPSPLSIPGDLEAFRGARTYWVGVNWLK
jgi:hypothetical protein